MELVRCDYCRCLSDNGSDIKDWRTIKGHYGVGVALNMCDRCYRPFELILAERKGENNERT